MQSWTKFLAAAALAVLLVIVFVTKRGDDRPTGRSPQLAGTTLIESQLPGASSESDFGVWKTASWVNVNYLSPDYRLVLDGLQRRFELVDSSMTDKEILETLQLQQFRGHLKFISQYQFTGGGTNGRSLLFENGAELSFSDFMGNMAECTLSIPSKAYSKTISISGSVDMSGYRPRGV